MDASERDRLIVMETQFKDHAEENSKDFTEVKGSLKDINKAVSLDPEFPPGYILRSLAFRMTGNDEEARKDEEYAHQIQKH